MFWIKMIIATIFAASASLYVYGDVLLGSQVNAFNATVVDNDGKSTQVHGKVLKVQVVIVYPSNATPKYDNLDWSITAQSLDGRDVAEYDFSLSDTHYARSSSSGAGDDSEEEVEIILLPATAGQQSSTSKNSGVELDFGGSPPLRGIPPQLFDAFSSPVLMGGDGFLPPRRTATRKGATTTEKPTGGNPMPVFPAQPFPSRPNEPSAQPDYVASQKGSPRWKRSAETDENKSKPEVANAHAGHQQQSPDHAKLETSNVHQGQLQPSADHVKVETPTTIHDGQQKHGPDHAINTATNNATNGPGILGSGATTASHVHGTTTTTSHVTGTTKAKSSTNVPTNTTNDTKMNHTQCHMKMNATGTGNGNTIIPSWMAIFVPSIVIVCTIIA